MSLWLRKLCVLQGWLFVSCQKRRSPLTTFKHILARTLVAAARGTSIFLWIFNKEGFVTNLKTLPPDAQFPEPQRHYEVARSPRRAHPSPTKTHSTLFLATQLKCRCGWGNCAFCKTTFKDSVRRVAAQITTNINVAVAGKMNVLRGCFFVSC
jgi:hypothetical protein